MTPDIVKQLQAAANDKEAGAFDRYEITQREVRELANYINFLETLTHGQRHNHLLGAGLTLIGSATPEPNPIDEYKSRA